MFAHFWRTCLNFYLCIVYVNARRYDEVFREYLLLKPLNDGKVAATFTFKTSLLGALPRAPQSLGREDLGYFLKEAAVFRIMTM